MRMNCFSKQYNHRAIQMSGLKYVPDCNAMWASTDRQRDTHAHTFMSI